MGDDNRDQDERRNGDERPQSERKREEVRDRADEDEAKQSDPSEQLGDLDDALEAQDYPTTTDELVETYGDYEVETRDGRESLAEVLAATENQTFDSADDVRSRILGLVHR